MSKPAVSGATSRLGASLGAALALAAAFALGRASRGVGGGDPKAGAGGGGPSRPPRDPRSEPRSAPAADAPCRVDDPALVSRAEELPHVRRFRDTPDRFEQRDPFGWAEEGSAVLRHHLTARTLSGKDKLGMRPLLFAEDGGRRVHTVTHIGRSMCGHDGIVHGGLIATLLDEALGRAAIPALPGKTGFTVNLNVNYRQPVKADGFYLLTADLERVDGRKAWAKAVLSDASDPDAPAFADATGLFVAPRQTPPSAPGVEEGR